MGDVIAYLEYEFINSCHCPNISDKILVNIWKYNLPLKVILFVWLCLSNRISTWGNLQKRGCTGANYCYLYYGEVEYVKHLFVDCLYTKEVIDGLSIALQQAISWKEPTLKQNMII